MWNIITSLSAKLSVMVMLPEQQRTVEVSSKVRPALRSSHSFKKVVSINVQLTGSFNTSFKQITKRNPTLYGCLRILRLPKSVHKKQ